MTSPSFGVVARAAALSPLAVIPATVPFALWQAIQASMRPAGAFWPELWNRLQALVVFNLFAVPIAYVLMLFVGIPAAALSLAAGTRSLAGALVTGALAGAGVFWFLKREWDEITPLVEMVFVGVVVAGVFWLLVRKYSRQEDGRSNNAA